MPCLRVGERGGKRARIRVGRGGEGGREGRGDSRQDVERPVSKASGKGFVSLNSTPNPCPITRCAAVTDPLMRRNAMP